MHDIVSVNNNTDKYTVGRDEMGRAITSAKMHVSHRQTVFIGLLEDGLY